jgi:tetratricopeptide (TPR) repeat protein
LNAGAHGFLSKLLLVGLLLGAGAAGPVSANGNPAREQISASALYNLGNSYARQGKPGMAVLYYERARVLSPNDPDIRANLRHVRTSVGQSPDAGSWLENHARIANPSLMYWLGLIGLSLAGASVLGIRFYPRRRRIMWCTLGVGGILSAIVLCDVLATWPIMSEAVVLHAAAARVSPVADGDTVFTLPEAQVVRITDEYLGYALIKTDAGQAGWVSRADLAAVTDTTPVT